MFGLWGDQAVRQATKAARKALEGGNPQEALRLLRLLLPNRAYSIDRGNFTALLKALKPIGAAFAGDDFTAKIAPAIAKPNNQEVLYQAGYDLIEYGLHAFATLPLFRLNHLVPGSATVVSELAAALEGLMLSETIVDLIDEGKDAVQDDPVCFYLLCFHLIMCGRLDPARRRLPRLRELMVDEEQQFMVDRVAGMLARADTVGPITGLSVKDLVGWHYVKTGGILTYVSPYGFEDSMTGRFALTQDSFARCRHGIARLLELLDHWDTRPPRVFYGRDRGSQIMGRAVAALLKVPADPLVQASGPGLIVFYDLAELEGDDWDRVTLHQPGRPLFVHALNWVEPPPVSPDVLTFLYQINSAPWAAHMVMDNGQSRMTEPDTRSVEALAQAVLDAEPMDPDDLTKLLPLGPLAAATQGQASAFLQEGYRERYWQGGPVKSNMFL